MTIYRLLILLLMVSTASARKSPDARFDLGQLQYKEDFDSDLSRWSSELEKGGAVSIKNGALDIDVPAGCTVWFKPLLSGPLLIQYDATVISAGGPNDRVSDLNCFWMARDSRGPGDIFATNRSGKFADYDQLLTYYVGLGGNTNTTTRFRRYIGRQDDRPLLPENDLRDKPDLITPNQSQIIRLVAYGNLIQYWRNDKKLFELTDPHPYTSGWFALRTTKNHLQIKNLRIWTLTAAPTTQPSAATAPAGAASPPH
jgi:hypothetical protein